MSIKSFSKDTRNISIIAMVIIFLALIRCIAEPFRLQYYASKTLTFTDIKPFLIGALVTSLSLLAMTILSFFGKYKFITPTCILTIVALFVIKGLYMTT